ncbi:hypothetical protein FGL97_05140 [Pseudomonas putida]|uniref:hypothetical protein n=1 Tax=Pseudomonas putida TaxID=303 RepID=UPI00159D8DD1|nr:hypothetical protein [Pseudomonas putida]NVN62631.1 hypothetical protein [Pseudomonas putida]NVN67739.1 hypothetical protein [Pseudomonas putida]
MQADDPSTHVSGRAREEALTSTRSLRMYPSFRGLDRFNLIMSARQRDEFFMPGLKTVLRNPVEKSPSAQLISGLFF